MIAGLGILRAVLSAVRLALVPFLAWYAGGQRYLRQRAVDIAEIKDIQLDIANRHARSRAELSRRLRDIDKPF